MAKPKTKLSADLPLDFLSGSELKAYIQQVGKTAQSRLKSLEKAYAPGGSLAGRQSYILDKYGGLNTKTAGLSEKALRLKAQNIQDLMQAKSSTVKGVKDIDRRRLESFKENHPNFRMPKIDKRGKTQKREPTKAEWERAMQILGKIQKAEKGGKYDSNEQMFMAFSLAAGQDYGIAPEGQDDTLSLDNFLNESGEMIVHSNDFFSAANIEDTLDFMDID